ncbi:MAG TPA: PIN domain-containing protein [Casimicrobiaceae bacterium]
MRIFLDANVLFSAAKSDGAVRQLVSLLLRGRHQCCVDSYVVEEARRNLLAKAPDGVSVLDTLLARLHVEAVQPGRADIEGLASLPQKDRPVLAAAIRLGCEALITGDRTHFGFAYGKKLGGVAIHSPRSIAEALLEKRL